MRDRDAPLSAEEIGTLAWDRMDGLLPAAVQDADTRQLLMIGYMDRAALAATLENGAVTFFSRSKARLWRKGETSGNTLGLVSVHADCDADALLVTARPVGPTCHRGTAACFDQPDAPGVGFLGQLARIVAERAQTGGEESYTARLLAAGPERIAQKLGEEAVETALAAVTRDKAGLAEEIADLLYHLIVLMEARELDWSTIRTVLIGRHGELSTD
ncbi:MAG: bifunctional phosphoribosyl-AMP cyclohydrolase/phosphoribosyl-ATP diphosphatase HisIE [Parasphingopyxis sp.]|nr:bifunctional phosphoribosyl-AMP cyclohydrolase/phosphoribosyl-ATP diphosphatase HisIE [Sphingomonadales bacterium]